MKRFLVSLIPFLAVASMVSANAWAAAQQPTKPVGPAFFTGRWYEIARTINARQRDCEAPTYDFKAKSGENVPFVLTCRRGSPKGKAESMNVNIKMPTDNMRNKFRVSAMGGMLGTDYWVLDRADDLSWAIMGTSGGNYVWLLSRKPTMDAPQKAQLLERLKSLGYDLAKIVQPKQG